MGDLTNNLYLFPISTGDIHALSTPFVNHNLSAYLVLNVQLNTVPSGTESRLETAKGPSIAPV